MKHSLRKTIRAKLAEMPSAVAQAKSMAACKRLLEQPEFAAAQTIMIYLPLPREVDVSPVALRGWQEQKTICAPRLSWEQRHMLPVEIRSLDTGLVADVRGLSGLREPAEGEPIPIEMVDLVLVPALAYDRKGNRLGRGAGFYDRFLAQGQFVGVAVGIAFREQLTEAVPVAANDVPVHMLVTDEEVLRFSPVRRTGPGKDAGSRKP